MLSENIKSMRKAKGYSQEELAIKLNVVRQTVSKWEKGLSVPDAEMLIRLAEQLDTTVNVLLGEKVELDQASEIQILSAKLELLNEQFAKQSESYRRVWRGIFIVLGAIVLILIAKGLIEYTYFIKAMDEINTGASGIGGADAPTDVYVTSGRLSLGEIVITLTFAAISAIGIYKTRRK